MTLPIADHGLAQIDALRALEKEYMSFKVELWDRIRERLKVETNSRVKAELELAEWRRQVLKERADRERIVGELRAEIARLLLVSQKLELKRV